MGKDDMTQGDFKTMCTRGEHLFPAHWKHILPEDAQWLKFPAERRATCNTCPKVLAGTHHPDTKCCSHFPEVVNFLLGFALEDAASRPLIESQIAKGHMLPTGQCMHPGQYRLAMQTYANNQFGELPSQACPFLKSDTMACGIYAHRNSVCGTFFCENDHGKAGENFWEKTQNLVGYIEIALSQAAMQHLGLDVQTYVQALDQWAADIPSSFDDQGGWNVTLRQTVWGDWFGREAEFFLATAQWVREHRHELYELACEQTLYEARGLEAAIEEWLPEAIRPNTVPVSLDSSLPVPSPIEGFWYTTQLAARQLWAIPFGDAPYQLNPKVTLPVATKGSSEAPSFLQGVEALQGQPLEVTPEQLQLLRLFQGGRAFNEALIDSPEMAALEDGRGFLAECLQLGVLLKAPANSGGQNGMLPIL